MHNSIKLSRTEIPFVAPRTPRGGFDLVRLLTPKWGELINLISFCDEFAVSTKITCNISRVDLNKTVSQIR